MDMTLEQKIMGLEMGHGWKPQTDRGKLRLQGGGRETLCALRFKCVFLFFIRRMKGNTKKTKNQDLGGSSTEMEGKLVG